MFGAFQLFDIVVESALHPEVQQPLGTFDVVLQPVSKDHPLGDDVVASLLGRNQIRPYHYMVRETGSKGCMKNVSQLL